MGPVSESSKHPSDAPEDGENERPTVVPPFDVEEMARRSRSSAPLEGEAHDVDDMPTVIPPPSAEFRARVSTAVDAAELEDARRASMRRSSLPPALSVPSPHLSIAPSPPERPGEEPVLEIGDADGLEPIDEARMLLEAGDESGALALVEGILRRTPSNAPARQIAEDCERA